MAHLAIRAIFVHTYYIYSLSKIVDDTLMYNSFAIEGIIMDKMILGIFTVLAVVANIIDVQG